MGRTAAILGLFLAACGPVAEGRWAVVELEREVGAVEPDCADLPEEHPMSMGGGLLPEDVPVEVLEGELWVDDTRCHLHDDGTFVGARSSPATDDARTLVPGWFVTYTERPRGRVEDPETLEIVVEVAQTCEGDACAGVAACGQRYRGVASWIERVEPPTSDDPWPDVHLLGDFAIGAAD